MTRASRLPSLAGLLLLGGCLGSPADPGTVCTLEARAGITVEILDGTGTIPLADGSVLTLKEGSYVETVSEAVDGRYLSGAWERAGTYDVRIDREGHVPWRSAGIEVASDGCHVQTVALTAPMVELNRS
jgi:hypothetical protein